VDPVYFDKAYYLAPDKGGAKPYALLAKALRESQKCALGRWAARGKQYIVMLRAIEDGLVMQQLLYAGEVRSMKDIEIPPTEVKDNELKLAKQLIEAQSAETFDPTQYTDTVAERIQAAIQKKIEGQEIAMSESPQPAAQVIDLMEALRASLERKGARAGASGAKPAASAAKTELKAAEPEVRKPPKKMAASAVPKKVRTKA
jgi:DNA end-binding protein Ku